MTFQRRGTASSVSVMSSPIFDSLSEPQHVQVTGPGTTTRSRGRWPAVRDGTMSLDHGQFEALFTGLDWRRVRALSVRPPAEAE